jgi:hypothetical protein
MLFNYVFTKRTWILIFILIGALSATLFIIQMNKTVSISIVKVKIPEEVEVISRQPLTLVSRSGNLRIHVHTLSKSVKTAEIDYVRYLESKGLNYQIVNYNVGGKFIEGVERADTQDGKQYKMIKISIEPDLIIDIDFLSDSSEKARKDFVLNFLKTNVTYSDRK